MPIFVGGTGLYFTALTDGLADIPPIPPEIRAAARALLDEIGVEALACAPGRARSADRVAACAPPIRSACCAPMKCSRPPAARWREWQRDARRAGAEGHAARRALCSIRRAPTCAPASPRGSRRCWSRAGWRRRARWQDLDPALPAAKLLGLRPLQALARGDADPGRGAGRRHHRHAAICQAPDDLVSPPYGHIISGLTRMISNINYTIWAYFRMKLLDAASQHL